MAGDYIKCPRCELNYIHKDDGYCDVCKAELKLGPQLVFAVDEDEEEAMELCPVCKQVYIKAGEEMCAKCMEEESFKNGEIDMDKDEEWKNYLDDTDEADDIEDDEMQSLDEIAKEEAEEFFDDEEEEEEEIEYNDHEEDDFEIPEVDEKDFEDYEEEEEEEEDDF